MLLMLIMCYNLAMDPMLFVRLIWYFTVFSVAGYFIEVILCSIDQKRVVNRGFLFGPYLPIYGFGGIFMMYLTRGVRYDFVLTFLISMTVGAIVEYISSYILEKLFHVRWWDYSQTDKLNLNGRICVRNTLAFGVGGCVLIYWALPAINGLLRILPVGVQVTVAIIAAIIFAFDTVISTYANAKVTSMADFNEILGDQTNEIKKYAKLVIKQYFASSEKVRKAAEREAKKQKRLIDRKQKQLEKMLKKKEKKSVKTQKKAAKSAKKSTRKAKRGLPARDLKASKNYNT